MKSALDRGTRWMRGTAVAVLTALALSGGFHLWHHLTDADCERPAQGGTHPCSLCSALHSAALAEGLREAVAPAPSEPTPVFHPASLDRADDTHRVGAPRAPPSA